MDVQLNELRRQHKVLDREITDAVKHHSIDDLKIGAMKRRKLHLKEQIEIMSKNDSD